METEKGKTFRYLREKREVSQDAKDRLREFNRAKKEILGALKEKDMTVNELGKKLDRPGHEIMFYLMTLVKYGSVEAGDIDDMDEYFSYKLKK